jgi:crossover junction endodeoxyribonuclease RuvC
VSYKRIAGIDQSLNSTGIVVIDGETGELIHTMAVVLNKNKKTPRLFGAARLVHIRDSIKETLEKYAVDYIAFEGYSFGSVGASVFDLGEIGGGLRILAHDLKISWVSVPPKTLKKYTTGNGNASKDEMVLALKNKYGVEFSTNDEADAFALAHMAKDIGPDSLKDYCYRPHADKKKGKKTISASG